MIDDSRTWRHRDPNDEAVSLREAVVMPNGTLAFVRGSLLVLDHAAWLCDELLPGLPLRPAEPCLRVEPYQRIADLSIAPTWKAGEPGVQMSLVLLAGIVVNGELRVGPSGD